MLWLQRPPWGRYATVALLVAAGILAELHEPPRVLHPFAGRDLVAGLQVGAADVDWRPVPPGMMPPTPDPTGSYARHDIDAGTPLRPDDVGAMPPVPADWWSVPVDVPLGARPGTPLQLVLLDEAGPGPVITATFLRSLDDAGFDGVGLGLVAVPGEVAAAVAAAAEAGKVVVLLAADP